VIRLGVRDTGYDILAADSEGMAVVPIARARDVLNIVQEMDLKERSMYPVMEKLKSLGEAIGQFGGCRSTECSGCAKTILHFRF
jgi:hypothetical protein